MDFYVYPSVAETADLILQRVYARGGKISRFSWKDGRCCFSIDGCRAEEVVFDKVCSVSYGSRISDFTASFPVLEEHPCSVDFSAAPGEFLESLNDFLAAAGAYVQQGECYGQKALAKFFVPQNNLRNSLFACVRCACRSLWSEEQVEISGGGNGAFVSAGFLMGAAESPSVLPFLASYAGLFSFEDVASASLERQKNVLRSMTGTLRSEGGAYVYGGAREKL